MIKYRKGYRYQLAQDYTTVTAITGIDIEIEFITMTKEGVLSISKGYAWDGPSGPAIDTKNFIRPSLIHDVIYQLIRQEHLAPRWRSYADDRLKEDCLKDGMNRFRAWYVHKAVTMFAQSAADPKYKKEVFTAP